MTQKIIQIVGAVPATDQLLDYVKQARSVIAKEIAEAEQFDQATFDRVQHLCDQLKNAVDDNMYIVLDHCSKPDWLRRPGRRRYFRPEQPTIDHLVSEFFNEVEVSSAWDELAEELVSYNTADQCYQTIQECLDQHIKHWIFSRRLNVPAATFDFPTDDLLAVTRENMQKLLKYRECVELAEAFCRSTGYTTEQHVAWLTEIINTKITH